MHNPPPLTLPADAGAIQITETQLASFGIDAVDTRGDLETRGPWSIPVRYRALAVSYVWGPYSTMETVTLYGMRTMGNLKESAGYCLRGRVSIGGHRRNGFTSAQLWELPDGRLIETATIHVCCA